jgi:cyclic pyranopterin phosphate synthase
MKTRFSYAFEELTDDLPRPPKAALRAMFAAGILVAPKGWKQLTNETRQALALEGTRDRINVVMVAELLKEAPPGMIRLVAKDREPPPDLVPAPLAKALGPMRTISTPEWASLRALDRYVLATLASNTRLLWRALEEMAHTPGSQLSRKIAQPWSGSLAHCELTLHPRALERLSSPGFLEGRAFVLARAAGVRAARKVSDILDLQADAVAGPAELDWNRRPSAAIVWQAHVSTWDGEFFPAASLLAVNTAAIALYDMAKELDPHAVIGSASIAEEPWQCGQSEREEPTAVYNANASSEVVKLREERRSAGDSGTHQAQAEAKRQRHDRLDTNEPDPFSNRQPLAPPPNMAEPQADRDSTHPPAVAGRMSTRTFMLLLMISMLLVAIVSTVVSVVVVKMVVR